MSTFDDTTAFAEQPPPPRRRSGIHPVNTGHLVMGVALSGLVVVWALLSSDTVQLDNARWILPLPWLVGGAVGVIASLLRGRRYDEQDGDQPWDHQAWSRQPWDQQPWDQQPWNHDKRMQGWQ
ncbi:hypothetical protein GCM10022237_29620 [Nocardioides ginsengisoli]|uniref:DUF2530 domain-containing protein n=1 Tax=Nocardioides ginsengisoli TaxID=363868 RepID=A0ABW3VWX2_9ACTN